MRKTLLAVAAAVAIFSIGSAANRAEAMTVTTPSTLGVVTTTEGLLQQAYIACGPYRCARVWPRYRYWGPRYYRRRYWW
jgi:hypothetical protein